MLITRIRAKNFKTYKDLDLNLEVEEDKPIILIGGMNGGGKTTLFQAIYHALYGLNIRNKEHFRQLLNATTPLENNTLIELDIDFKGRVLLSDYFYRITRRYTLNPNDQPVESVTLNFNGDTFTYGTATPAAERALREAEVNKIIKANLPKELSRYFLFDAMESGKLLEKDSLSRVIKENIESVMGFNKYIELGLAATKLKESYVKESLDEQTEKEAYEDLLNRKEELENTLAGEREKYNSSLAYSIDNKDLYTKAKEGKSLQEEYQERIRYLTAKIDSLKEREADYLNQINKFTDTIELQVFLPNLVNSIQDEVELILSTVSSIEKKETLPKKQLDFVVHLVLDFLEKQKVIYEADNQLAEAAKQYVIDSQNTNQTINPYDYFSEEELQTLSLLLKSSTMNSYPSLEQYKKELEVNYTELPKYKEELEELNGYLTNDESSLIQKYEENEALRPQYKSTIADIELNIENVEKEINSYDISSGSDIDPKLNAIKKIEPLFNEISAALLKAKKKNIEETMCEDLNRTLTAYFEQIDRVELSDTMDNLSFKMYHKHGNEIYLNQLNAASKQVVVQVLLKSLHQYGDYNPPVMIDTVMGYLDKTTRDLLLKNYFPQLSHQTILFSTDSEITTDIDLPKIEKNISRTYTLVRNVKKQQTIVTEGYFKYL